MAQTYRMTEVASSPDNARAWPRAFLFALLAATILRVIWALVIPVEPVSDSKAYATFASVIVKYGVYGWTAEEPGLYWPVGTSAITALTYLIHGEGFLGSVILNIAATLAMMVFVFRMTLERFGETAAVYSAFFIAVWPNLIFFTTIISSELYFLAFLSAGLYFWTRSENFEWKRVLLTGVMWGAACYLKSIILLFPIALLIAALPFGTRQLSQAAAKCIVVTVVILATVAPWTYRNYVVFGEPVLMSANLGATLWMGNNPNSEGDYMRLPHEVKGMTMVERERYLKQEAYSYIASDPVGFLSRTLKKAIIMNDRESIGVEWNRAAIERKFGSFSSAVLKIVSALFWYVMLFGGILGFIRTTRDGWVDAIFNPFLAGWAYFIAIHAVIIAGDRYHMPTVPFVVMYASFFWAPFITAVFERRMKR
jgi:4-amino-4-deoxy-L-arabinose transferase-like glycosyltransferase